MELIAHKMGDFECKKEARINIPHVTFSRTCFSDNVTRVLTLLGNLKNNQKAGRRKHRVNKVLNSLRHQSMFLRPLP